MKVNHSGRRRAAAALIGVGAALALSAPSAHANALAERTAAQQCEKRPDDCKVTEVGKSAHALAGPARKGKSRCRSWRFERWGKSAVGIKVYSYYVNVSWCTRRGRITSASSRPWPEVHAPLWTFDKHLAHRRTGGKRKRSYKVFAQGQFKLCITKLGCVQDRQPWISVTARGDGSHSYETGG